MRLRRFQAFLITALLAAAATVAWARAVERVLPGQKVFGELSSGEKVTVLVDAVAGMPLSATAKAFKGTTLRIDIALADPDGTSVDLTAVKKTNAKQSAVSFAGVVLARTGSYRLTVSSVGPTFGGFDLATKGAAPKSGKGAADVASAGVAGIVAFDALPGDRVVCKVKAAKGSALKPIVHRFVDAGGAEQLIDAAKQTTPSSVTTTGTSRFEITGDAGSVGAFTWSLKFTRAKAPKESRDAADLSAAGTVTGVVVLDGQATRTSAAAAKARRRPRTPDVRPGELIVAMPEAASFSEVGARTRASMPGVEATVTAALSDHGPYLVRIEQLAAQRGDRRAKTVTRALAKSAASAGTMRWCEPNGVMTKCTDPNDTRYGEQFNLRYLRLPNVWNRTEGDPSMTIAVIDTGYRPHPDLTGIFVPGFDFISDPENANDGDGWDSVPLDDAYDFHGTHVTGILAAHSNNKSGVAGVVWQGKIQPVRALGKYGGTWFDVAAAIRWAAGLPVPNVPTNPTPARVINMSLGGAYDAQVVRDAIDGGGGVNDSTDAVIVAAAGNEVSSERFYPAAYPGVIPVYALDANLLWASYSNYGDWISVGAPGGDQYRGQAGILSTFFDSATAKADYEELSGTSMASPQVAGVVALLISKKPTLTRTEIRDVLEQTALDLGDPGFDTDFGWGMVDAEAALDHVLTPFAPPNAIDVAPSALSFEGVANQSQVFVRTKSTTPVTISDITPTTNQGAGWIDVVADQTTTPATLTVTISPLLDPGSWTGKLRLTTSAGVVDVPIHVVRAPRPKINFVVVSAVDAAGRAVAATTTNEAKGWAYTLPDVPLGRYRITALADVNSNLVLDRIDEWDGLWPLRTAPDFITVTADDVDAAAVDVPLERYDSRFSYDGVGSGRVTGAVAVRATDSVTGRPIAAANVHLSAGAPIAITDARGRAVFVGGFSGGQFVTVTAEGSSPMSRSGFDAQFQAFPLESLTPAAKLAATATIRGLTASDRDVFVQVGDAKAHVVYAGGADPVVPLAYTDTGEAVPVSASAFDATGMPTKHALFAADSLGDAFDVAMTALPIGGVQARFVQPSLGTGPFTVPGHTLTVTTSVRWDNEQWLAVGDSALVMGQSRQGWWADPLMTFEPALPMRFDVTAADTAGRTLRRIFYGTTTDLQPAPQQFTFDPAPTLSSPASGAVNVPLAAPLAWTPAASAAVHKLVIEKTGTPWRWTIWLAGGITQVTLPVFPSGGLEAATNYRWSVETYRFAFGGFDVTQYREDELEAEPSSRTFSGWSAFRTQ